MGNLHRLTALALASRVIFPLPALAQDAAPPAQTTPQVQELTPEETPTCIRGLKSPEQGGKWSPFLICMNQLMAKKFVKNNYPWMDIVYVYHAKLLKLGEEADRKKITKDQLNTEWQIAYNEMQAEDAKRTQAAQEQYRQQLAAQQAQQQASQQHSQDQQRALAAMAAEQERNAEVQRQNARTALLGAFLASHPFQTPQVQPYYIPMPQQHQTNCTTSYVGNQAYTNCQ